MAPRKNRETPPPTPRRVTRSQGRGSRESTADPAWEPSRVETDRPVGFNETPASILASTERPIVQPRRSYAYGAPGVATMPKPIDYSITRGDPVKNIERAIADRKRKDAEEEQRRGINTPLPPVPEESVSPSASKSPSPKRKPEEQRESEPKPEPQPQPEQKSEPRPSGEGRRSNPISGHERSAAGSRKSKSSSASSRKPGLEAEPKPSKDSSNRSSRKSRTGSKGGPKPEEEAEDESDDEPAEEEPAVEPTKKPDQDPSQSSSSTETSSSGSDGSRGKGKGSISKKDSTTSSSQNKGSNHSPHGDGGSGGSPNGSIGKRSSRSFFTEGLLGLTAQFTGFQQHPVSFSTLDKNASSASDVGGEVSGPLGPASPRSWSSSSSDQSGNSNLAQVYRRLAIGLLGLLFLALVIPKLLHGSWSIPPSFSAVPGLSSLPSVGWIWHMTHIPRLPSIKWPSYDQKQIVMPNGTIDVDLLRDLIDRQPKYEQALRNMVDYGKVIAQLNQTVMKHDKRLGGLAPDISFFKAGIEEDVAAIDAEVEKFLPEFRANVTSVIDSMRRVENRVEDSSNENRHERAQLLKIRDDQNQKIAFLTSRFEELQLLIQEAGKHGGFRGSIAVQQVNFFSLASGLLIDPRFTSSTKDILPDNKKSLFQRVTSLFTPGLLIQGPTAALAPWFEMGDCWCGPFLEPDDPIRNPRVQIGMILSHAMVPTYFSLDHISHGQTLDPNATPKDIELWVKLAVDPSSEDMDRIMDAADSAVMVNRQKLQRNMDLLGAKEELTPLSQPSDDYYSPRSLDGWLRIGYFRYQKEFLTTEQTFQIQIELDKQAAPISHAAVRVLSTWGESDHVCLYRLKLYGYKATINGNNITYDHPPREIVHSRVEVNAKAPPK